VTWGQRVTEYCCDDPFPDYETEPVTDSQNDYIRARRNMPEPRTRKGHGLANTALRPDYLRTGLFAEDVTHRITVIKKSDDLFMFVRNSDRELLCHWKTDVLSPIAEGRIGLRHMCTRAARYRDFRISQLNVRRQETLDDKLQCEISLDHV
jgi:hypothetical protein